MPINFSPSLLIFINQNLVDSIQATLSQQLYLTEIISKQEFDNRMSVDPNYHHIIHLNNLRVLVMLNLQDKTNREFADIVLFFKYGLISVECNKYGPPKQSLPLDRLYLSELVDRDHYCRCCCRCCPNLFNQFVGEPSGCFNFDPHIIYPRMKPMPEFPIEHHYHTFDDYRHEWFVSQGINPLKPKL
jgi:hypothetical protein